MDKPKALLVAGPSNILRSVFLPGSRAANAPASASPSPLAHPPAAAATVPPISGDSSP